VNRKPRHHEIDAKGVPKARNLRNAREASRNPIGMMKGRRSLLRLALRIYAKKIAANGR
jgi:hypothetical protein